MRSLGGFSKITFFTFQKPKGQITFFVTDTKGKFLKVDQNDPKNNVFFLWLKSKELWFLV